jgi:hypothetical protein
VFTGLSGDPSAFALTLQACIDAVADVLAAAMADAAVGQSANDMKDLIRFLRDPNPEVMCVPELLHSM